MRYEIDDEFSRMTVDELISYVRRREQIVLSAINQGEPWATQVSLDELRASRIGAERSSGRKRAAAHRNLAIAMEQVEDAAHRYLAAHDADHPTNAAVDGDLTPPPVTLHKARLMPRFRRGVVSNGT